jgi:hypothetical protein
MSRVLFPLLVAMAVLLPTQTPHPPQRCWTEANTSQPSGLEVICTQPGPVKF